MADALLARAAPAAGERVLDLACGTGLVALAAAAAVGSSGRVVGVDLSGAMLQQASLCAPRGVRRDRMPQDMRSIRALPR
jgi:ubiquinone/menaquinone biosynthesis C-methylase UbiE